MVFKRRFRRKLGNAKKFLAKTQGPMRSLNFVQPIPSPMTTKHIQSCDFLNFSFVKHSILHTDIGSSCSSQLKFSWKIVVFKISSSMKTHLCSYSISVSFEANQHILEFGRLLSSVRLQLFLPAQ